MVKIINKSKTKFKECEIDTTPKLLLNICDLYSYGFTDSNIFYRNLYSDPEKDYSKMTISSYFELGDVFYSKILSYLIMANIVCVEFPKTTYNLIPFKYKSFKKAAETIIQYIEKHEIKEVHTPIFANRICEGDWSKIIEILKEELDKVSYDVLLYVYK